MNNEIDKRSLKTLVRKKRMQMKYLLTIVFTIIAMMIIVVLTIYISFLFGLEKISLEYYTLGKIKDMLLWLNAIILVETIIFVAIASWLSLGLSHKIAGPLYRIEKVIKEGLDNGELIEIKIRKNDELHEFVEVLNELIRKKTNK
ncbi:MAG: hypothetical protein PHE88_00535 [Elusimicrobia bacterium]|nr:hypothetical protein [Elusimicrobiota bacterium]